MINKYHYNNIIERLNKLKNITNVVPEISKAEVYRLARNFITNGEYSELLELQDFAQTELLQSLEPFIQNKFFRRS